MVEHFRLAMACMRNRSKEVREVLDAMWCHHQDGSDLLVNRHELFDVVFNRVMSILEHGIEGPAHRAFEKLSKLQKEDPIISVHTGGDERKDYKSCSDPRGRFWVADHKKGER